MTFKDNIDFTKIPKHVAVIMDGNGRWAREKGASRIFGHRNAIQAVRNVTEGCGEIGVKYLTLYAFSTENWERPKDEVNALMELLLDSIHKELKTLQDNHVKLTLIGEVSELPNSCQSKLMMAMEETKNNTGLHLTLAVSYSGRWEITQAAKRIAQAVEQQKLTSNEITESVFTSYLQTATTPDPDLMIRTGGDERISNFLLWQLAYTELVFLPTRWPDFQKEDLYQAICSFQKRERRFGTFNPELF